MDCLIKILPCIPLAAGPSLRLVRWFIQWKPCWKSYSVGVFWHHWSIYFLCYYVLFFFILLLLFLADQLSPLTIKAKHWRLKYKSWHFGWSINFMLPACCFDKLLSWALIEFCDGLWSDGKWSTCVGNSSICLLLFIRYMWLIAAAPARSSKTLHWINAETLFSWAHLNTRDFFNDSFAFYIKHSLTWTWLKDCGLMWK